MVPENMLLPLANGSYAICAAGFGTTQLFSGTSTQVNAWYGQWYAGSGAVVNVG